MYLIVLGELIGCVILFMIVCEKYQKNLKCVESTILD